VFLCVLLFALADLWWPATVLMFLPRGYWAVPLAVLAPALAFVRPRRLWLPAVDLLLIAGPLTGFNIPVSMPTARPTDFHLRILSCNVHWGDLDHSLARLIERERPDLIVLQGWSSRNQKAVFGDGDGWRQVRSGEFLVASRFAIEAVDGEASGFARFGIATPIGRVELFSVHLRSPREGLLAVAREGWRGAAAVSANTDVRRRQSALLSDEMAAVRGPLLAPGDFNTPPESRLWGECWSPYRDAFGAAGWGWGPTHFYSYYESSRIDHILTGPGWRCRSCWVGPDVASPHHPVLADLDWVGTP
jgi:endonuclease/exonuclease/phosphatase (EEP) superfamily protein YafD